jgi:hypothetical protein
VDEDLPLDMPPLQQLDLSDTPLRSIGPRGLYKLTHLQRLNMRGSLLEDFSLDLLHNLTELTEVLTPNFRLCCPGILPPTTPTSACVVDTESVSSCEDLLRLRFYQVALIVISLVAVLGNAACVIIRLAVHKESMDSSFSILLTSLNTANLLMGVYCGIIAGTDQMFRGSFVHNERAWTDSATCQAVAFLYVLSSEVSALTITLITWDRVTRLSSTPCPSYSLQLGKRSSVVACVLVWVLGATLSTLVTPLLWEMYRPSGICIPLPVVADRSKGSYSLLTHAGLRPMLTLMVSAGQAWLYRRLGKHKSHQAPGDCEALRLARQFMQVAVTDCVCWAVVCSVTVWSLVSGVGVSEDVNVALAILLQPINTALNPCLYLTSKVMGDRSLQREARLVQLLKNRRGV